MLRGRLRIGEDRWTSRRKSELIRRKKDARVHKKISKQAKKLRGIKGKIFHKERYREKVELHKKVKAHQEKDVKTKTPKNKDNPVPTFLMDRE